MKRSTYGFTIVELLIVIVVIGILAAITIVAYNGVQKRAAEAKIKVDIQTISKAVVIARDIKQGTLHDVSGTWFTSDSCIKKPAGTDLSKLPKSDTCWVSYLNTLAAVSSLSGVDINNLVDPWGRPYIIDQNEGENGLCYRDYIAAFPVPFTGQYPVNPSGYYSGSKTLLDHSGFTSC